MKRINLKSSRLGAPSPVQMAALGLAGLALTPAYCALARLAGAPGLAFRGRCFRLALRLLARPSSPLDLKTRFLLLLFPLDSTRYFEMEFMDQALAARPPERYLDVSSPRLLFTLLLTRQPRLEADLINPDQADLEETRRLLEACGLLPRCRLSSSVINDAPFAPASFDTITCMSVVEHIPEDRQAIARMWELLRPGGRLLLTMPCAAEAAEQYIDRDEYGVLAQGREGAVFWQRFYDPALLSERIFSVTGPPREQRIFGEREAGLFARNARRKREDRYYPFWREPYMVAREYRRFDAVEQLPGEGVIALEFVKP